MWRLGLISEVPDVVVSAVHVVSRMVSVTNVFVVPLVSTDNVVSGTACMNSYTAVHVTSVFPSSWTEIEAVSIATAATDSRIGLPVSASVVARETVLAVVVAISSGDVVDSIVVIVVVV